MRGKIPFSTHPPSILFSLIFFLGENCIKAGSLKNSSLKASRRRRRIGSHHIICHFFRASSKTPSSLKKNDVGTIFQCNTVLRTSYSSQSTSTTADCRIFFSFLLLSHSVRISSIHQQQRRRPRIGRKRPAVNPFHPSIRIERLPLT